MIKVGLTGNIGSGKTMVSKIFESIGVPVFYADENAKSLYREKFVIKEVIDLFGKRVLRVEENIIDLKVLAEIVFSDKAKLDSLTQLLHPLVFQNYKTWINENEHQPYSVHESAVMFEYGQQHNFHKIICVTAPEHLRIERVLQRDKSKHKEVQERINNQMKEIEKIKLSNFIVKNDHTSFLIPQILKIHKDLLTETI